MTFRELCCLLEHILSEHLTSIVQTNLNSALKAGKNMVEFRFLLFHESNNKTTHYSVDIERNRMFNEPFLWYHRKLSDMMADEELTPDMYVDVAPTHTWEECVAWLDTNPNYGAMFVRSYSPSPVVFLDHDPELYMKKMREEQRCNVS